MPRTSLPRSWKGRVSVSLKLCRGEKPITAAAESVPAARVPDFLRRSLAEFAKAVDVSALSQGRMNREEEVRQLSRQAGEHQRLGNWGESLSLAEAALLLKPGQPKLHHDALVAISGLLRDRVKPGDTGDFVSITCGRQAYRRGLYHFEAVAREEIGAGEIRQAQALYASQCFLLNYGLLAITHVGSAGIWDRGWAMYRVSFKDAELPPSNGAATAASR